MVSIGKSFSPFFKKKLLKLLANIFFFLSKLKESGVVVDIFGKLSVFF